MASTLWLERGIRFRVLVIGYWEMDNGYWEMVIGYWKIVTGIC